MFSNIVAHPKTSIAGVLIGTVTVAGVLSQQGITLGKAGTGTVVALIGALATALLGLSSKDPGASSGPGSGTAKLGCWALISLLVAGTLPMMGCNGQKVAQDIVNWTPALQGAVATVDSSAALLDPQAGPIFMAATAGFDAASNALVVQAKAYLANPGASVLAQLQTAVVTFQQQVNASLLQAAHIANPASQQHALTSINAVATVVNAILALVESISSKAAVAQMAAQAPIKLASVQRLIDQEQARRAFALHYVTSRFVASQMVARGDAELQRAGF
ncbi:MAG TPA: hypothetical protein VKB88_13780 [Bryobacteraceae bacterium]|nr:hypothetical protein [Bryobacteraceae bacterium]